MSEQSSTGKRRGRPPKQPVTESNINIENEQYIYAKEQNVSEVSSYSDVSSMSMNYFGLNIFDLYDANTISNMIKYPMAYNEQLRNLSQQLYSAHGIYSQSVDYCTSLPTLDYIVIPNNKSTKTKRIKNKEIMETALEMIHHKEIIRDALYKDMIDGTCFYYAEITKTDFKNDIKSFTDYDIDNITELNEIHEINGIDFNISVLPLPTDFTKIVGRRNSVYVIAFNLRYFEGLAQTELSRKLRCYPKEIRDAYNKYHSGQEKKNWVVLDYTKTIVSKVRSKLEEPYGRPMCLGAIKDILYSFYYNDTKRSQLDEMNNRIIYQTLPEGKDKNLCGLTEKQSKQQHEAVRDAIMNKNTRNSTSFFTVQPTTKIDQIKVDTDIFDDKNESRLTEDIGADLGFMSSLLTGNGSGSYSAQANNLQLLLSEMFMWIEPLTKEIVKVVNKNIIKDKNEVDLYYLPCSTITRKDFTSQMKDLYLQGKGSLTAWIASTGFNSSAYLSLMNEELENKFDEKYQPHPTSFNTSGDESTTNKGGRKESEETTDGNATAKNYNSNDIPSPSDSK